MRCTLRSAHSPALFTGLFLIASLQLSAPLAASGGPASTFSETLDVEVVNLEVYVTNRRGEPVTRLSADDFQVYEDGKPVEVTNFYAVEDGSVAHEGLSLRRSDALDEEERGLSPLPDDQKLHAVLFIDGLDISPRLRNKVIADLLPFVEHGMRAGDRTMIVSHGASLEIIQGFTDDRGLLKSKLEELASRSSLGAALTTIERDGILREIADANLPIAATGSGRLEGNRQEDISQALSEAQSLYSAVELYAQRHQDQTFETLEVLRQFVDSLAGIPGRKAVVYISEGLSLRPGEALFHAWHAKFSILHQGLAEALEQGSLTGSNRLLDNLGSVGLASSQFNLAYAFRELGNRASANRVTFYGLRAADHFGTVSADVGGFDLGAMDSKSGGQTYSVALEGLDAANRGGGLWELADATGGFAITNASNLGVALDKLRIDFDAFYSIGYVSGRPADEKKHRLEVRTSSRSHQLRYRRIFRDKSRGQKMNDRTLAALTYDAASNPLGVEVQLAAATVDPEGHQHVPILVEVPVENLTLLPLEGHYEGRLSIHVGARDSSGRTSPIRSLEVPIRIPKEALGELVRSGKRFGHHFLLEMIPDQHRMAIGVRDEIADVESTALIDQPVRTISPQPAF